MTAEVTFHGYTYTCCAGKPILKHFFFLAYLLPFNLNNSLLGIMKHKVYSFKDLPNVNEKSRYRALIFSCQRLNLSIENEKKIS